MKTTASAALAIGAACLALTVASGVRGTSLTSPPSAAAPVGADTLVGVDWVNVAVPTGGTLCAAVARPSGPGPHAVLIILHGTHGYAREYVVLARDLAREAGVVAIAAGWFAGRKGAGVRFVTPIECPDAPPMPSTAMTPEALVAVDALVDAARAMPEVRPDRVGLLGHSRGAVAALYYSLERGGAKPELRALVLNSGAYPPELMARAANLNVPTLILHGTADNPAEGGSEMTAVVRAREFEAALLEGKKAVESEYFEDAGHNALFTDDRQRIRSIHRVTDFLRGQGFE